MALLGLIPVGIALFILAGAICGITALVKIKNMRQTFDRMEGQIKRLQDELRAPGTRLPAPSAEFAREAEPPSVFGKPPEQVAPMSAAPVPITAVTAETCPPPITAIDEQPPFPVVQDIPQKTSALSLEMRLGTRWIIWLGAVIFLGGVALALKYTYDNNLIGPSGRLMIGALTGIVVLFTGEYYYRRRIVIPSQAFTGGGLAILYLCIFFSFQVYHLTGAGFSMTLAVIVTGLAVFFSLVHNALPIALLAVTGGYLSPVFLSTGQNAPWMLFSYVALLNLVALGAAFFKRWRVLDVFCFVGTAALYLAWHDAYFAYPDQIAPALTFITLFYLIFMAAPMVYGLVRGIPEGLNSLTLLLGNSLFWLSCYYVILFEHHRRILGFIVLAQAVLVFLLYLVWMRRIQNETNMAKSLLGISLALLTLVIPLQLRFTFVPIAWAAQGTLIVWLSFRFNNLLCRLGGVAVLILSVGGLLQQMPLHVLPFTPVLNIPFGTWVFVILCIAVTAGIAYRRDASDKTRLPLATVLASVSLAMACILFTMETFLFWQLEAGRYWIANATASLTFLWTILPALITAFVLKARNHTAGLVAPVAWAAALLVFILGLGGTVNGSDWLFFNLYFIPRILFVAVLWRSAGLYLQWAREADNPLLSYEWYKPEAAGVFFEMVGHASLAVLFLLEWVRWGKASSLISPDMAVGIVSAVWALHACILIWHGLVTRNPIRRYAGFVLFAVATTKTVFFDAFNLDAVYRIVSWLGVGMLLVIAALLYQRYKALLSEDHQKGTEL